MGQTRPTELTGGACSVSELEGTESDARHWIQLAADHPSPEREVETAELRAVLRKILATLEQLDRAVLLACYIEGENVAQMARVLGYSRGHLSLLKSNASRRGRIQLRASLGSSVPLSKQVA